MNKLSLIFFLSFMLVSCSEEIYEYEEMVRQELKANDRSMSEVEIKKWALYLSKWSEPDFYHKEIKEFKDQDALSFPKKNSILFVGSSSIVYWKNLKELNHGKRALRTISLTPVSENLCSSPLTRPELIR